MEIIPITRDDLFDLEEIESDIFHEDAFGVFMLEQYISKSILYSKIINKTTKEIIGFSIVSEFKKEEFDESFLNYCKDKEIIKKNIEKDYKNYAHLVNFVVRREYWGLGYGKILLEHIIKEISKLGYNFIMLEVNQDNKRALSLYENYGFIFQLIIENYYNSGANAKVMVLNI